jgi:lipid-A-disaccharide synthase
LQEFSLHGKSPIIGLFPGSRKSELKYNLATILASAARIRERLPDARFVLPVAPSFDLEEIHRYVGDNPLSILLMRESVYDIAHACDAVITVSGTATLQIALVGTPMAIVYKMAPLTYAVGRRLIKMPHIGLVNIVAGKEVVKEFVQHEATAENVAKEIFNILENTEYNRVMREELSHVRSRMGEAGCSERVARMASELSQGVRKKELLL